MDRINKRNSWQRIIITIQHQHWTDSDTEQAEDAVTAAYGDHAGIDWLVEGTYTVPLVYSEFMDSKPNSIVIDVLKGDLDEAIDVAVEAIGPLVVQRCQIDPDNDEVIAVEVWRSIAKGTRTPLTVLDRLAAIPTDEVTS